MTSVELGHIVDEQFVVITAEEAYNPARETNEYFQDRREAGGILGEMVAKTAGYCRRRGARAGARRRARRV